ncbi:hypothetical protein B0H13DRAFT_1858016 [Mycena leptocephala]|nr:hypothetical protein B0H13DRAFT_1858016 [Mycena leptocephala]
MHHDQDARDGTAKDYEPLDWERPRTSGNAFQDHVSVQNGVEDLDSVAEECAVETVRGLIARLAGAMHRQYRELDATVSGRPTVEGVANCFTSGTAGLKTTAGLKSTSNGAEFQKRKERVCGRSQSKRGLEFLAVGAIAYHGGNLARAWSDATMRGTSRRLLYQASIQGKKDCFWNLDGNENKQQDQNGPKSDEYSLEEPRTATAGDPPTSPRSGPAGAQLKLPTDGGSKQDIRELAVPPQTRSNASGVRPGRENVRPVLAAPSQWRLLVHKRSTGGEGARSGRPSHRPAVEEAKARREASGVRPAVVQGRPALSHRRSTGEVAGRLSLASRRTAVEEPQAKRGTLAMRPVRPTLVKGPLDSRVRGGAGACAGPTNRQPTVEKPQADGEADDEPERTDRRSKELAAQIMVMSSTPAGRALSKWVSSAAI